MIKRNFFAKASEDDEKHETCKNDKLRDKQKAAKKENKSKMPSELENDDNWHLYNRRFHRYNDDDFEF